MDIDFIETAGAVMGAGPLDDDPAGGGATVTLLEPIDPLFDPHAEIRRGLHSLEIDLGQGLHVFDSMFDAYRHVPAKNSEAATHNIDLHQSFRGPFTHSIRCAFVARTASPTRALVRNGQ